MPLQTYIANCIIQHKKQDEKTKAVSWEQADSMQIEADSIEALTERAHLYTGSPTKHEDVLAIKLTGSIMLMNQEQHAFRDYKESLGVQINVLTERNTPLFDNRDNQAQTPLRKRAVLCN